MDEAMENEGWKIDDEAGVYYLPPTELVTESSLGYYMMSSFTIAG